MKWQETFLFLIYLKSNYVKQGRNNFKMIKVINIRQKDYVGSPYKYQTYFVGS